MLIGYARVSTKEQNLTLQLQALEAAGCEKIFSEQVSGSQIERDQLKAALRYLRPGDTLVVWKLDRMGRSLTHLINLVEQLNKKDIQFQSLTDAIDTRTPSGRFFFNVMASLAQMERDLIVERTKAGLLAARKLGRIGGRKRKMTDSKIESAKQLLKSGVTPKDVALNLGISVATLYRWIPSSSKLMQPSEEAEKNELLHRNTPPLD